MRYRLFGLSVETDLPLPTLRPERAACPPDLRMRLGAHPPDAPRHFDPWYVSDRATPASEPTLVAERSADGWVRLSYGDGTGVTIDPAGTRVGCTWPPELTVDDAATYLLGPVCGVILRMRGVTCLHASALEIGGRAVLVCGPAGAGKSTTAAALAARGHRVLADDVAALDESDDGFDVRPAYPQLKLWPDAAAAMHGDLPALTPNWDKRYLALAGEAYHPDPLRVAAVYVLAGREDVDAPRLEAVSPSHAVLTLVANTYMGWLPDHAAQGRDLALYGRMARAIPMSLAVPHRNVARLGELCEMIEADVARRGERG